MRKEDYLNVGTRWVKSTPDSNSRSEVVEIHGILSDIRYEGCKAVDLRFLGDNSQFLEGLESLQAIPTFLSCHIPLCHIYFSTGDSTDHKKLICDKLTRIGYTPIQYVSGDMLFLCSSPHSLRSDPSSNLYDRPVFEAELSDLLGSTKMSPMSSSTPACDAFVKDGGEIVSDTIENGRIDDQLRKISSEKELYKANAEDFARELELQAKQNKNLLDDLSRAHYDIDSLEAANKSLRSRLNYCKTIESQLTKLLRDKSSELEKFQEKVAEVNQSLRNTIYDRDTAIMQREKIRQENLSKDKTVNNLKEQLSSMNQVERQLLSERDRLYGEIATLSAQLNKPKETIVRKIFK